MLPDFDDNGNLPPGLHRATIEEVVDRFGQGSFEREAEIDELIRFVNWARERKVRRLLVNGSFVTSAAEPNDVDIVVLPSSESLDKLQIDEFDDMEWPFLQVIFAADDDDFERWANRDFATDRDRQPKGVVEIGL